MKTEALFDNKQSPLENKKYAIPPGSQSSEHPNG
jgi:hypothetical protein